MSTTTAAMLLLSADRLARELYRSTEPVSLTQWETFDNTVFRCLYTLVGPGRRLSGHDSAAGSAAVRALQEYPTPLRPAPGEVYSPREAARLTGSTAYRVTLDAVADRIHAKRIDRALQIPAEELDHRPDLTPAVSTDPHPLLRLSVAIGAMTDVVASHRAARGAALTDDSHIAAAMRHVLSLTAVAARHTLSRVAIAEAERPLLIAQYTQRAVDALEARSGYPQLWTMTSTNPPLTARNLNDRLEIGLRAWSATAAQHLQHPVPSTDLIRNIANQGTNILAVTDAVIAARQFGGGGVPYGSPSGRALREVATSLREVETAWAPFTTAMPPSHDYVTASRAAFSALNDIASVVRTADRSHIPVGELDRDRALLDLAVGTQDLVSLLSVIERLPHRMLDSGLLFVRARTIAPRADTLEARSRGQLVVARPQDAPNLVSSISVAAALARTVPDALFSIVAERGSPPLVEGVARGGPLL